MTLSRLSDRGSVGQVWDANMDFGIGRARGIQALVRGYVTMVKDPDYAQCHGLKTQLSHAPYVSGSVMPIHRASLASQTLSVP